MTARAWARELEWEQVCARKATAAQACAEAAAAQVAAPVEPVVPVVIPAPRPPAAPAPVVDDVDQEQELVLDDLTREQVIDWHAHAAHPAGLRCRDHGEIISRLRGAVLSYGISGY
ncbi:hypothetical protein [Streptomyces sp. NPDC127190]|uniref:hypothetical protein n=1 Tax=unclassified Streptomyces TaxID=2593676 RepID=UPI00363095E5